MVHAQLAHTAMVSGFVDSLQEPRTPYISPKRLSKALGVNVANLAELTGVHRNTLRNPSSERLQGRMREMVKVISCRFPFNRANRTPTISATCPST